MSIENFELTHKIQEFKLTEYYNILFEKINSDWKSYSNELRANNDEVVRGKIHYIEEMFNWLEAVAREELEYNEIVQHIKNENDY